MDPEAAIEPRPRDRRRHDAERRLAGDLDLWVATASATGTPHLVPLSFDWDGEAILMATAVTTPDRSKPARPATWLGSCSAMRATSS